MTSLFRFPKEFRFGARGGYKNNLIISGLALNSYPKEKEPCFKLIPINSQGKPSESMYITIPISSIDNFIYCLEEIKRDFNNQI